MSQINTQNLLKLNPIEPNVNPAQVTPNYKSSQYSGGQLRLGQVAQQVGPTGDAAMFKALSEIASGVGQAINTFADIGSKMDQERIRNAKLYFDELDIDDSLEPTQKEERLNEYLKEVSTPILGKSWVRELNTAVNKNWTSEDARNRYEEQRWNKEYQTWKNSPKNKDRIETNEVVQEFNDYYQYNYPLAKHNNWFLQTSGKVDSAIKLKTAEQASNNLQASLDLHYDFPNADIFSTYNNSTDPTTKEQIERTYSIFFPLLKLTESTTSAEEIQSLLMKDAEEKFKNEIQGLDEAVKPSFYDQLNRTIAKKSQELFNLKQSDNARQVQAQAATNIAVTQSNFDSDKNIGRFLNGMIENVGNLDPYKRQQQVSNIIPLMWKTLSTGTSSQAIAFQKMTIDDQIKEIETVFDSWWQKNNLLFADVTGITDIEEFKAMGRNFILSSDELGGKYVNTQITNFTNYARQLKDQFRLQSPDTIQGTIEQFRTNLAETLGVSIDEVQELIYSRNREGQFIPEITSPVQEWFSSLSPESQQNLINRGYTVNNFDKLESVRTMYVDLESAAVATKSTGEGSTTSPLAKKTDGELKSSLLMDPSIRSGSYSITPETADQDQLRLLQVRRDMQRRFDIFLAEKVKVDPSIPYEFSLFQNTDGTMAVEAFSTQALLSRLTVDSTGSLDTEGKKAFLRLQFAAMEMARIQPTNTEQNNFKTEVKTSLTQIGSLGFNQVMQTNPSQIYGLIAMLEGLSSGDPNFINSQLFTGADSEGLKAIVGLLKAANKLGGGIIDLTPGDLGDNDYKTGFKTVNGVRTPLSQEEKDTYNKHPMRRIINAWSIFMDSFAAPIAEKGGGQINPIIQTGSQARLTNIRDEINAIILAYLGSGPTIYRENEAAIALIKRLQFPGKGTENDKIKETADVFWRLTGSVFPRLGENKEVKVRIPTDDGMINKSWNELTVDQQIGVYIAALAEVDRDSFSGLLGGWLRNSNNQATRDIYTLDMFEYTFDFLSKDLLKPTVIQNGQVTPPKYRTQTFDRTSDGLILTPELVNDGVKVNRSSLLNQARGLAFTQYTVGQETNSIPWYQEGYFTDIFIPGETETNRVLIGSTTSEDDFVLRTYLSTEMKPNSDTYGFYKWWAERLNKTPVSEKVYNAEVKSRLLPKGRQIRTTERFLGGPIITDTPIEQDTYPPLFEVMSALHQLDLTDPSTKISVDSTGQMYFDIGSQSYLIESQPPLQPKTEFTNKNEAKESSLIFQDHLLKLDRQRAIKRVKYQTKKEYPIYLAPVVSKSN